MEMADWSIRGDFVAEIVKKWQIAVQQCSENFLILFWNNFLISNSFNSFIFNQVQSLIILDLDSTSWLVYFRRCYEKTLLKPKLMGVVTAVGEGIRLDRDRNSELF